MGRKILKPEEVELLRNNKYTKAVSPRSLYLTDEFKELFWKEYESGNSPRTILEKYGYPADVLGTQRIGGFAKNLKKQHNGEKPQKSRTSESQKPTNNNQTKDTTSKPRTDLNYLREELELLKAYFDNILRKPEDHSMNKRTSVYELMSNTLAKSETPPNVRDLCKIAGVPRCSFYRWLKNAPSREAAEEEDRRDFDLVLRAYKIPGYAKSPGTLHKRLLEIDPPVKMSENKIQRLMKKYGLKNPGANPRGRKKEELTRREFYGPRMIFLTDIVCLPYNGKFVYLLTIMDAFTKQILIHTVNESLDADSILDAVNLLIKKYDLSLRQETVFNGNQGGFDYTSCKFIELPGSKELWQPITANSSSWNNASQDSFFGQMKDSINDKLKQATEFDQVKTIIDDYIDYYNNDRYQWKLAKLAPNKYYDFYVTGKYPVADTEEELEEPEKEE